MPLNDPSNTQKTYSSFRDLLSSTNLTEHDIIRRSEENQDQWRSRLGVNFTFVNSTQWDSVKIKGNEDANITAQRLRRNIATEKRRARIKIDDGVTQREQYDHSLMPIPFTNTLLHRKRQKTSTSPIHENCVPNKRDSGFPNSKFVANDDYDTIHDFAAQCRGSFMEATSKTIEWRGNGTIVFTCAPTVLDDKGDNLLETV